LTVAGNIGIQAGANAFIGTLDNFALSLRTNNTDRIFITNTGNVGIGTTAPVSLLELYKTDASPILTITSATSTTYSPQIAFRTGATPTTNFTLGVDISTGKLKIVPSSDISTSTGITIDSSGNVGIGTTTPAYKLDVAGNIRAQTSLTAGINVESLTGDKTLTPGVDKMFQFLNPNGANRTITLATTTAKPGDKFIIKNNDSYSSSYYLQIQQGSTRFRLHLCQINQRIHFRWNKLGFRRCWNRNIWK